MHQPHTTRLFTAFAAALLSAFATPQDYVAGTVPAESAAAGEVQITLLEARLRPLTKDQVAVETEAWMRALREKALEVRDAEVGSLAGEAAEKDAQTTRAFELRAERDKLIRRVDTALDLFEQKGGDVAEARAYVSSIVVLPPVDGFSTAWTTLRAWATNPEGGIALGLNLLKFLATLVAFKFLAALLSGLMDRSIGRLKSSSVLLRQFLVNSVKKVTFLIGIVIALSMLGINIGPFVAAIGAVGFIVGFALQGTLANFASGVMIMIYRPYDIGDVVTTAGITGKVDSMNLVSTSIRTFDNQTIVVPNGSIWGDVITNITANATRRVDMKFGIGYGDDIGKAAALLEAIVKDHPLVLDDPAPNIQVHELGDSSVNLVCRPWAKTSDYWDVYWDVTRSVKERFDAEGVTIPFPQRDVHLHQVAATS